MSTEDPSITDFFQETENEEVEPPITNVIPFSANSLEELQKWGDTFVDTGRLSSKKWVQALSAIKALTSVLEEEEPRDIKSLMKAADDLSVRWVRLGNKNPNTGRDYRGRMLTILQDFITFKTTGAMPKPGGPTSKGTVSKTKKSKRKVVVAAPEEVAPVVTAMSGLRSFPSNESKIFFRLSEEGITMADVKKIHFHLMTLTTDFDPSVFQAFAAPQAATEEI